MEPHPQAPVVVAVLVTHDAGPWLEEALAALRDQDYPDLSVLVIDAGSADDPTPRVASVLPGAYVRRLDGNPGWSVAANQVLDMVEGAAFYVFCHDDVAPDPDAVRLMVEEALRSNAGVVGPKLVFWDEPERLAQVGMAVDKTGAPAPLADKGELDQEQHDAVRDVFVVPGACTLVRADLFAGIGGYDPVMTIGGEDVDLCWRALVAGARVMVVPAARVRHVEALPRRGGDTDRGRLEKRHRVRALLKNYGRFHLARVLPQAVVAAVVETVYSLLVGHWRQAREVVAAWTWNLRRLGEVRAARRAVQGTRVFPDREVRRLQVRGSARVSAFVRGQLGGEHGSQAWVAARQRVVGGLRQRRKGFTVGVWLTATAVLALGSRELLGGVPAVGELPTFPSAATFVSQFFSGWRVTGLGADAPAPTAFALLGVLGYLLAGAVGLLRTVLVLGLLPLGLLGAWRLAAPLSSRAARLVAVSLYLAVPLPYNALARGRWGGLVLYAVAPFLLSRLLRATGLAPFAPAPPAAGSAADAPPTTDGGADEGPPDPPAVTRPLGVARIGAPLTCRRFHFGSSAAETRHCHIGACAYRRPLLAADVLGLGVLVAVAAAVVPWVAATVVLVALALTAGSLLAGAPRRAARSVVVAVGAAGVAAVLHVPWTFDFVLPGGDWAAFAGVDLPARRGLGLGALLRFQTGPRGAGVLGWALLVAAALPLLVGTGWRLAWAVRLWAVALGSVALAWVGGRDWLGGGLPAPEVLLAPAAIALALAGALGMKAFEVDLHGYRFGWRQVVSGLAAVAAAGAVLPVLGASIADGRWGMPDHGWDQPLSWLDDRADEGAFRVLWVGDPETLPLAGWELDEGLAYATSRDGLPDVTELWPGSSSGATRLLADAVLLARDGSTNRLGRLLAPMAVRYVAVPSRLAPDGDGAVPRPVPAGLVRALGAQLDLRRVDTDPALLLYENTAWVPGRATLTGDAAAEGTSAARVMIVLVQLVLWIAAVRWWWRAAFPARRAARARREPVVVHG